MNDRVDLRAGDQQRVEHPAAVLAVIGKPAEEHRRPLGPGRDVERVGRLRAFGLGQLGRPEDRPAQHRVGVGPGPAARQVDRPRIGPGRLLEPGRIEVAQRDLDLEDRPAGPEPVSLHERRQALALLRMDQAAGRRRLHERGTAVIDLESLAPHLR